jgi:hypothetical protein
MNYRRNIDPMPKRRNHTISNGTFELIFGWTTRWTGGAKRSALHAIQKEHSSRRVAGCDHVDSVGRRRWRLWRGRCQRLQRNEWNRNGQPGRNESRLRSDEPPNDTWFSRQSSSRLRRRIERHDRKRAEQHSNSDRIEHDKFDGRHRVLMSCFYEVRERP